MHIAVTGARGFIGRRVVEALLSRGVRVTSLERQEKADGPTDWPEPRHDAGLLNRRLIDLATISNRFHADCGSPDVLLHLAWGGLPNYTSSHHLESELPLHTSFLSGAISSGTPHVIAVGTCFEYGLAEGLLSETSPTRPTTSYAEAKVRLHEALDPIAVSAGTEMTWLRPFYVFGPGQPITSLWGQLHAAIERGDADFLMSGGEQTRDYLPVEEAGRLIAEVAVRPPGPHRVLNVCSGRAVRIRDLVDTWIDAAGSAIRPVRGAFPYSAVEPMHAHGSTARLNALLARSAFVG